MTSNGPLGFKLACHSARLSSNDRPHMPTLIVVSGLPASGKTTLACTLAAELGADHIDKDRILEGLFLDLPCVSEAQRSELSRQADRVLQAQALSSRFAVVSSWWRHPLSSSQSGTPTDWLMTEGIDAFEVFCRCPVSVAVQRFVSRRRDPSHLDQLRTLEQLAAQFAQAEALGAIFPGQALAVDTSAPVTAAVIAEVVRKITVHRGSASEV